jgi:hypothetical protein
MKKLFILLFIILLASCNRDKVTTKNDWVANDTVQTILADTIKYEEVRYVTARRFTSSGLYNLHCKQCHGINGTGDGVLARYNAKICPHDLSKVTLRDQEVYFVILNGEEHMPPASKPVSKHVLTNDDIWIVVYYIKKFKK